MDPDWIIIGNSNVIENDKHLDKTIDLQEKSTPFNKEKKNIMDIKKKDNKKKGLKENKRESRDGQTTYDKNLYDTLNKI